MAFGKKKKAGWVYGMESTRRDGSKKMYVGSTSRSPSVRFGEHIRSVKSGSGKTWVSRGTYARPVGAVWSSNAPKAERTIKSMPSKKKKSIFGGW